MCGIVGFVGKRDCVDILIDQLLPLEYRGYDSAGVAIIDNGSLKVTRNIGKINELVNILDGDVQSGFLGIAHTRWATHGAPSTRNAHPHIDCKNEIAVVHNGIIENYLEIKQELQSKGHNFKSETDSEIIPHLIEEYYSGDLVAAVRMAVSKLRGSYALGIISTHAPDVMIAVRKDSPLVIGLARDETYIASDIPALLKYTRDVIALEDGDMAIISGDRIEITGNNGKPVSRLPFEITWDAGAAEKGGYDHFMLKEIHEEPSVIEDTLRGRLSLHDGIELNEITITPDVIRAIDRIFIVACGTAYYAGCVGKHFFEKILKMPVEVELASEFRYRDPVLNEKSLVLLVSQSGETADTLAALRLAKSCGSATVGLINVVGSTMSREADDVLYTRAGPEICVASTKAYVSQLIALYLLGIYIADIRGSISSEQEIELAGSLRYLSDLVKKTLETEQEIAQIAEELAEIDHCFYLGRGLDYAVSLEGALKLKEISYIHAEAYAAGEMKHGPLALITEGTPVICLVTQDHVKDKMLSNIKEVQARRGKIVAIAKENDLNTRQIADYTVHIPCTHELFMPVLSIVPLHLLAYYTAKHLGRDIDQPRNLAKSVTVE